MEAQGAAAAAAVMGANSHTVGKKAVPVPTATLYSSIVTHQNVADYAQRCCIQRRLRRL
jgi:hypothetical protein